MIFGDTGDRRLAPAPRRQGPYIAPQTRTTPEESSIPPLPRARGGTTTHSRWTPSPPTQTAIQPSPSPTSSTDWSPRRSCSRCRRTIPGSASGSVGRPPPRWRPGPITVRPWWTATILRLRPMPATTTTPERSRRAATRTAGFPRRATEGTARSSRTRATDSPPTRARRLRTRTTPRSTWATP